MEIALLFPIENSCLDGKIQVYLRLRQESSAGEFEPKVAGTFGTMRRMSERVKFSSQNAAETHVRATFITAFTNDGAT